MGTPRGAGRRLAGRSELRVKYILWSRIEAASSPAAMGSRNRCANDVTGQRDRDDLAHWSAVEGTAFGVAKVDSLDTDTDRLGRRAGHHHGRRRRCRSWSVETIPRGRDVSRELGCGLLLLILPNSVHRLAAFRRAVAGTSCRGPILPAAVGVVAAAAAGLGDHFASVSPTCLALVKR